MVQGSPAGSYTETGTVSANLQGADFRAKGEIFCNPDSGVGGSVSITIQGAGWRHGNTTMYRTDPITLHGYVLDGYFSSVLDGGNDETDMFYQEHKNVFGHLLMIYRAKLKMWIESDTSVPYDSRTLEVKVQVWTAIDVYSPPGTYDRTIVDSGTVAQEIKAWKIEV